MRIHLLMLTIMLLSIISIIKAQNVEPVYYRSWGTTTDALASNVYFFDDTAERKHVVFINNPQARKFRISVYKDGMKHWYKTCFKKYTLSFNLSQAEAGEYVVDVYGDGKRYTRKFVVKK